MYFKRKKETKTRINWFFWQLAGTHFYNGKLYGTAYLPGHLYTRFGLLTNRNITWFKQLTNRKGESCVWTFLICAGKYSLKDFSATPFRLQPSPEISQVANHCNNLPCEVKITKSRKT